MSFVVGSGSTVLIEEAVCSWLWLGAVESCDDREGFVKEDHDGLSVGGGEQSTS